MNFDKLDIIVTNFVNKKKFHVSTLPNVVDMSKKVLEEEFPIVHNNYSRQIDINESIKIVYNFLMQLDVDMANQFMNIINAKDENSIPYVNILPKGQHPNGNDEVKDGRVYIYYENTPNDPFIILHEMLHKMNECNMINENNESFETFTRDFFGEAVSITGELMLGYYMIQNGLITENDFNIRKIKRLNGSKENARDVIIEKELIDLKLEGKNIDFVNLINTLKKYNHNSIEYKILSDEKNDLRRISSILKNDELSLTKSQRYVIAQYISEELIRRTTVEADFIKLHYAVGDADSNVLDIYNELMYNNITI